MMYVTADFKILQHLNLNIFQCINLFLSRNLKTTLLNSIFIISSCHFILCAIEKMNDPFFMDNFFEKTTTLSLPLTPPKKY